MNVAICIKGIKDELVDKQSASGEYTFNPYDLYALNSILELRNTVSFDLTCVTMGGEGMRNLLTKCYACGVDTIMWLKDPMFAGSDTVATTKVLYHALQTLDNCKLIVCGEKAVDGETGQVPPGLAERLKIQYIGGVKKIIELTEDYIVVEADDEEYHMRIKAILPAIISFDEFTTVTNSLNLLLLKKARKREIPVYSASSINLLKEDCGMTGSRTRVICAEPSLVKKDKALLLGSPKDKAIELADIITKKYSEVISG